MYLRGRKFRRDYFKSGVVAVGALLKQSVIAALKLHKLLVRAGFDYIFVVDKDDIVGFSYCGQAVRYDKAGASL